MRFNRSILILLLLSFSSFAQNDSAVFLRYDITNGLPGNNVYMVLQDHLGYLWFATAKGVAKYDGYNFRVFNTADGLQNADVWKIQEDAKGRMWVYSNTDEFGYIKDDKYTVLNIPKTGRILRPSRVVDLPDGKVCFLYFTKNDIRGMCFVGDTSLLIKGYYPYLNGQHYDMILDDDKIYGLTQGSIYQMDISEGRKHELQLKCASTNMNFGLNEGRWEWCNKNSLIFVSGKTAQMHLFNVLNCQASTFDIEKLNNDKDEYYYTRLGSSDWMTVMTNKNIYKTDSNLNIIYKERLADLPAQLSQVNYVMDANNGSRWYTTISTGAVEKRPYTTQFARSFLPDGAKFAGNLNKGYSAWWNDKTDDMYLASSNRIEKAIKIEGHKILRHVSQWSDSFYCLSFNVGIYLMNIKTQTMQPLLANKELVLKNYGERVGVLPADFDSLKRFVLKTPSFTCRFDSANIFTLVASQSMDKISISGDTVFSERIDPDKYDDILFDAARSQLYAYNSYKLTMYNTATKRSENLVNTVNGFPKRILRVQMDSAHDLYVQSENTIYKYQVAERKLSELHFNVNLNNVVFRVSENNLVVCGRFGALIAKTDQLEQHNKTRYFFNSGLYNEVTDAAISDGVLYLLTDQGCKTASLSKMTAKGVVFDEKNPLFHLLLKDTVAKHLLSGDTVNFYPGRKNIAFSTINFYGKGSVLYEYRVKELNTNWTQSDGELFFDNMLAGHYYTLEIVIKDEYWKSDPYYITIYRQPYWFQTTWGKILIWSGIAVAFILLVLVIIYFTRRYVAKANEKRQQLTDLELRAIHSQINPHFIFNTLSTALYFINRNEMEAAYEHVNKFSHLLRSYLKSSQERYISLAEEIEMLKKYIELQQSRFGEEFEFILKIDNKLPLNHMQIPSLLLQPLVENAINHGLFHKKGKGILKIAFEQGANNEELICTIDDNGVGRKEASAINAANEFKRESYGSKLTQGLIDIFEQYEQMNIDISYTDKQAPETGTVVTLVIKNIKYVTM